MGMRMLILLLLMFMRYEPVFSQIVFKNIESKVIRNTFTRFRDFLIRHPTDTIGGEVRKNNPEERSFYDTVINTFFNRSEMIREFSDNKSGYDFSSLMTMQYQILHNIDKTIDQVRGDSIFVMKSSEYYKLKNLDTGINLSQIKNRYLAGFIINNETYPMVDVGFDSKGNSFVMMLPMLYFDAEAGRIVRNFLERQQRSIRL